MSKYLTVFKTGFKQEKDTIFDNCLRCIMFFIIMYILIQLWNFIYGDNGTSATINGYSLNQMIWYLIIGECIVNSAKCNQITRSITNEIKTGSIAYKLNKPYNYYLYNISTYMAKSCFLIIFTIPTAILIGGIFVGLPENFELIQILPCMLTFLMSVLLSWCLYGAVGLIAFWVQDSTPFYWIVSKTFMLLGMFFPLEFFPNWLQPIIRYSPIYSIMSGPASLVANFSWGNFGMVIASQTIWCAILILLGLFIYKLGKRRVTSNGG
jgi:ABC-2 type transport system permease protein